MDSVFRFKEFELTHGKSSMKVGVDAVLLGAWAGEKASVILDVGTGCGIISLMLAQRFPEALIDAVDIDALSVEEATANFTQSLWTDRLKVWKAEFPNDILNSEEKYDLIVSNPPFFLSGVDSPSTRRERARHQDKLSVFSLIEFSPAILKNEGTLAMIFPYDFIEDAIKKALENDLFPKRICRIKNREGKKVKRVMMEFQKSVNSDVIQEDLTLFNDDKPSEPYKNLCKDFYLKF